MGAPKKTHLPGITFTGTLAKPIDDIDSIRPFPTDLHLVDWAEHNRMVHDRWKRLCSLRAEKIPELARQLGVQVEGFDLTTDRGLATFYRQTLIALAIKAPVPGFLEVKPKEFLQVEPKDRRALTMWVLDKCTQRKQGEPKASYLNTCLHIVCDLNPDLARGKRLRHAGVDLHARGEAARKNLVQRSAETGDLAQA